MAKGGRLSSLHIVGIGMIGAAAFAAAYFHSARDANIATVRQARAEAVERGPRVEVVASRAGPAERVITLLADVRPMAVATLYAKVSGYLKTVKADRGDRVEAGQIVAEIESPELEQQYMSASADLENKRRNHERLRDLLTRGATTTVAALQAETDARMAEANVAALATNKSYQVIRAPFAGRVAVRFVDQGALITNAQTNQASSQPIMTISDDSRLRVFAYIQQQDAPFVHVGDRAEVVDASNPERRVSASVTRTTGELNSRTRTMQIEVNIDNSNGFLVAGSFAYVTLRLPIKSYPQIPVSALVIRGNDNFVAALDNDIVRFKPVTVAATEGGLVSIASGLQPGETIAINLPDEVGPGSRIQPVMGTGTN